MSVSFTLEVVVHTGLLRGGKVDAPGGDAQLFGYLDVERPQFCFCVSVVDDYALARDEALFADFHALLLCFELVIIDTDVVFEPCRH